MASKKGKRECVLAVGECVYIIFLAPFNKLVTVCMHIHVHNTIASLQMLFRMIFIYKLLSWHLAALWHAFCNFVYLRRFFLPYVPDTLKELWITDLLPEGRKLKILKQVSMGYLFCSLLLNYCKRNTSECVHVSVLLRSDILVSVEKTFDVFVNLHESWKHFM